LRRGRHKGYLLGFHSLSFGEGFRVRLLERAGVRLFKKVLGEAMLLLPV